MTAPGEGPDTPQGNGLPDGPERLRVDKWLWHGRFFKSRSLAGEAASSGRLRVNGERITKPAHLVRAGDVLTFPQGSRIRVVRVHRTGTRRGPATEAALLYEDLDPPTARTPDTQPMPAERPRGSGRPTKRERRDIDALRASDPGSDT